MSFTLETSMIMLMAGDCPSLNMFPQCELMSMSRGIPRHLLCRNLTPCCEYRLDASVTRPRCIFCEDGSPFKKGEVYIDNT